MTATIAPKIYVTIQYRANANNEDGHLGFASPYTRDAAFQKRKATQDSWAYGNCTVTIDENDDVTFEAGANSKVDAASAFIGGWYPKIISNEPVEGFEIAQSIRRYGWSGSGNVVWRITDPRGFDLEISSDNFASIISCVDMEKGRIKGKCVWGREGSKNILLPEASEPYQEALARTKKVNARVGLKDIQIGDTVDLLTAKASDVDSIAVYYGKMHFLQLDYCCAESDSSSYYGRGDHTGVVKFDSEVKEAYVFKSVSSGEYLTFSTPKVSAITNRVTAPLDKKTLAQQMTAELAQEGKSTVGDLYSVVLVSDTKIDLSLVTTSTVPAAPFSIENWPVVNEYYTRTYYVEHNNAHYLTNMPTKRSQQHGAELTLTPIKFEPEQNKVSIIKTPVARTNYNMYNSYSPRFTNVTFKDFDFADLQLKDIVVNYGDLTSTILYLKD